MSLGRTPAAAGRPRTRGGAAAQRSTRLCVNQPVSPSAMTSRRWTRRDNLICAPPRACVERVAGRANSIFGPRLLDSISGRDHSESWPENRRDCVDQSSRLSTTPGVECVDGLKKCGFLPKTRTGFKHQCAFDLADVTSMCGPRPGGAWPTGTPTGLPTSASRALLKGATATASHRAPTIT